jgi:hypothetical protein
MEKLTLFFFLGNMDPEGYQEMSSILLTNSALVYESQWGEMGGGGLLGANEYSCAHHVTWSPNKL